MRRIYLTAMLAAMIIRAYIVTACGTRRLIACNVYIVTTHATVYDRVDPSDYQKNQPRK